MMRRRFAHAWLIACASAAKPTTLQVATYNVLNPVHKSVGGGRESDIDELWLARAQRQASFVAETLGAADVICLQEWFFEPRWQKLFEEALPSHSLCTARRGGVHPHDGSERRDGLAIFSRLPLEAVVAPVFDDGADQASSRRYKDAVIDRSSSRRATYPLPTPPPVRRRRRRAPPPLKGRRAATTRR